jgi:hypothetical protein
MSAGDFRDSEGMILTSFCIKAAWDFDTIACEDTLAEVGVKQRHCAGRRFGQGSQQRAFERAETGYDRFQDGVLDSAML